IPDPVWRNVPVGNPGLGPRHIRTLPHETEETRFSTCFRRSSVRAVTATPLRIGFNFHVASRIVHGSRGDPRPFPSGCLNLGCSFKKLGALESISRLCRLISPLFG